jgi:hypothetical protein
MPGRARSLLQDGAVLNHQAGGELNREGAKTRSQERKFNREVAEDTESGSFLGKISFLRELRVPVKWFQKRSPHQAARESFFLPLMI